MKNLLLATFLVAIAPAAFAEKQVKSCGMDPTYVVSAPLTIQEVERYEMAYVDEMAKVLPDLPRVPFAYGNSEWVYFKSQVQPGDKIVRFSSNRQSWGDRAGETGYALLRSGCVIERFVGLRN